MPRQSEALILRTYPFHEADLLVTFFTRAEGKIRGVARQPSGQSGDLAARWNRSRRDRALGGKRKAGAGAAGFLRHYFFSAGDRGTYPRLVALSYVAEVIDQLLPDREPRTISFG